LCLLLCQLSRAITRLGPLICFLLRTAPLCSLWQDEMFNNVRDGGASLFV
jgi:hypothetical protein